MQTKLSKGIIVGIGVAIVVIFVVIFILFPAKVAETNRQNSLSAEKAESGVQNSLSIEKTEPQIPLSEWGFNNSDDWGNVFVEVLPTQDDEVTHSDSIGTYVIIHDKGKCFEMFPLSGQILFSSIDTDFNIHSRESATYSVLDNNTITWHSVDEGDGVFEIIGRIEKSDSLIFEMTNNGNPHYYIPIEFFDTSKEPQEIGDGGYYTYYKFYIK